MGSDLVNKTHFDANTPSIFTSSNQAASAGSGLTIAHGLGAVPDFVTCELECTTAEFNYSIGDIVEYDIFHGRNAGAGVTKDATNLNIRFGATALQYYNKTTGAQVTLTDGSWAVRFKAVKY